MPPTILLPPELTAVRDALIDHVRLGTPEPSDLGRLQEWLEVDGWDQWIGADAEDFILALDLERFAEKWFSDAEISGYGFVEDDTPLTDAIRVAWARHRIQEELGNDDLRNPSIHSCVLNRDDDASVVVGCTVEIHGQAGAVVSWHGAFSSEESFLASFRGVGLWLEDELAVLSDETILSLWEK